MAKNSKAQVKRELFLASSDQEEKDYFASLRFHSHYCGCFTDLRVNFHGTEKETNKWYKNLKKKKPELRDPITVEFLGLFEVVVKEVITCVAK